MAVKIYGPTIEGACHKVTARVRGEMASRAYRGANELRNAELDVLSKQAGHGGRVYRVPGTKAYYRASAPGEVPAVRTGVFRLSWKPKASRDGDSYKSIIQSTYKVGGRKKHVLGEMLEHGTSRMAPRPHHQKILDEAQPRLHRIYAQRYFY